MSNPGDRPIAAFVGRDTPTRSRSPAQATENAITFGDTGPIVCTICQASAKLRFVNCRLQVTPIASGDADLQETSVITVHHLTNSHSHVVLWLLEELGIAYEMVLHRREANGRSPETLRAVHPAAKAPTIEDNGIAMIESTGVLLYLLETYGHGRLRPAPGTADAMRFFQWLTYIEGSAKGPTMQFMRMAMLAADDPMRAQIEYQAKTSLGLIESALEAADTIVPSQFSAADIQLAFLEELLEAFGQIGNWPNMQAHLARMRKRDAYRRAEQKGGAVDLQGLFAGLRR